MALHAQLALGLLAAALAVGLSISQRAEGLQPTTVSVALHEYAPNYSNSIIPCGSQTSATEVFATISAATIGIAPQVTLRVVPPKNILEWEFRVEPGGLASGTHEYGWSPQTLTYPGLYTFEAYVYNNRAVPRVRCDVTKV